MKDAKCATAHYQTVRELWKDQAAGVNAIQAAGGDDKEKGARLRRALSAAGEALFHAGEEKRLASEAEKFPVYTGSGKKDEVMKHLNVKMAPWIKARRTKIEEADKAYAAILGLQPAAVLDVGQAAGQFLHAADEERIERQVLAGTEACGRPPSGAAALIAWRGFEHGHARSAAGCRFQARYLQKLRL